MKKLLAIVISMAMVVAMMPMGVFAAEHPENCVAEINGEHYNTVQEAINACPEKAETVTTIELMQNVEAGESFGFPDSMANSGRNVVLNLNGYTYKFKDPGMGSVGTETQAMHLSNGNTLIVKNGTLAMNIQSEHILRMIQNYCYLTLEDVIVDTSKVPAGFSNYNHSFCRGTVTLKGNTHFKASAADAKIFDIDGKYCDNNNCDVELIVDSSFVGTIEGKIEYTQSENGHTSKITDNANYLCTGKDGLYYGAVASVGGNRYATLQDAISAIENGDTITIVKDINNATGMTINTGKAFTIDFAGHTYIASKPGAGSAGTETSMFQLLKDQNITFKNGRIECAKDNLELATVGSNLKRMFQCYAGLTLQDMVIDATNLYGDGYPLTFNHQPVQIIGETSIILKEGTTTAFDADGNWNGYDRCKVTVDTTGTIAGNVECGRGYLDIKNGKIDGIVLCNLCGEIKAEQLERISVTGGTFATSPKEYVDSGYDVYKFSDTEYKVSAEGTKPSAPTGYRWKEATGEDLDVCDYITEVIPYTPSTPTDNVTNNTTDKNTTADLTPAVSDNKSTTTVDNTTADKIVDKAVENKSTEVIVDAKGNNTVASSEVAIPEKTVKEISEKTDANLVIKTDNGTVDLDRTAVAAVAEQAGTAGTVTLVVETVKTDENICHVELKLVTSNGAVKDFKGGNVKVTIDLNKELAAKELVCVYIDDNGIYTLVEGVLNADGTYTFTTGHFSEYAVMAKADADKVIADQLNTLIKEVNLKVRTSKTSKKNIKAVVSGDVKALTDAGYTVKYKFYRSTKKASKYTAAKVKDTNTYINTTGKKGTKYYYKAKALVYDGDKLVGQTVLKQCKYGVRTWSK